MQSPNQLNLELPYLLICSPQPQPHEQILSLIHVTPSLPRSRFEGSRITLLPTG